ncbi:MAG: hypothetical protein EAZ30_02790 [Betaproteobacteria bacterium]|nr:MAG: hypothetical protein EAZ30_02790 [Betaproteobacteria bacterium]
MNKTQLCQPQFAETRRTDGWLVSIELLCDLFGHWHLITVWFHAAQGKLSRIDAPVRERNALAVYGRAVQSLQAIV